tara:strand:+ start:279 stop:833 length:555 start_codon:yes stop_codon:yes gene_type:complete
MKQLLITIAALVLVGCGPKIPNISIDDAARRGNIEAVKQHLAAGTDVNLKYKGGTPLHQAARLNKNEIVKLLISSGADIHVTDDVRGRTPLHFASNSEIAELLIVAGADVNAKARGSTPLHNAAYRGLKEIVELLIAKGANINPKNNQGKTALDEAIEKSHEKIAELLRKHGAKTAEELKASGN